MATNNPVLVLAISRDAGLSLTTATSPMLMYSCMSFCASTCNEGLRGQHDGLAACSMHGRQTSRHKQPHLAKPLASCRVRTNHRASWQCQTEAHGSVSTAGSLDPDTLGMQLMLPTIIITRVRSNVRLHTSARRPPGTIGPSTNAQPCPAQQRWLRTRPSHSARLVRDVATRQRSLVLHR